MKNTKNILVFILLLLVAGLCYYNYQISKENNNNKQAIEQEKVALEKELDIAIADLNTNQEQNISLTKNFNAANEKLVEIKNQLQTSKKEIQALKANLSASKKSNFNQIKDLRVALQKVKTTNQILFKSLDSIKTVNDSLMVTIAVTKSALNAEKIQSESLALKLSEATKVQMSKIEVFAVNQKKSGALKATTSYKKTDGIQLKYNVLNNKALKNVVSDIYYVLKNKDGLLVKSSGDFLYNGASKKFTDGTRLILNGETMPVTHLISLEGVVLEKGVYTLEFYSVDGMLAKESFELKSKFLGVF